MKIQRVRLMQVAEATSKFSVDRVQGPRDAFKLVRSYYKGRDREMLSAICLNAQNEPTCWGVVSMGALNTAVSHPREIFKLAILSNAAGVILVHNHPSGCLEPSADDIQFTAAIKRAGEMLGIELYDHLILADDGFTSLRDRGLL